MSDTSKYYYMRIKENFYETEEMILLQSQKNGYKYSDILMKLYLKSLKFKGRLVFKENIPYDIDMIATITRHDIDIVKSALTKFNALGLIDMLDNGTIYMTEIQNFIGQSSDEADRKRNYRNRIESEKQLSIDLKPNKAKKETKDKCPDKIAYILFINSNYSSSYIFNSKEIKRFELFDNPEVNEMFNDFLLLRTKLKKPAINTKRAITGLYNKLIEEEDKIKMIMLNNSIEGSWKTVYPLDVKTKIDINQSEGDWFDDYWKERNGETAKSREIKKNLFGGTKYE